MISPFVGKRPLGTEGLFSNTNTRNKKFFEKKKSANNPYFIEICQVWSQEQHIKNFHPAPCAKFFVVVLSPEFSFFVNNSLRKHF